jgi:hypothetical protein
MEGGPFTRDAMTHFLDAARLLQKTLSLGGLAVALAGVATFGWYFIRINALAAEDETNQIPPESWRGRGAKFGLLILVSGIGLALAAMFLGAMLPGRY